MDYYIISQDERFINFAEPSGLSKVVDKDLVKSRDLEALNTDPVMVYIKEKDESEFIDIIEKPVLLISDKIKQVFERYGKDEFYKPVILGVPKHMETSLYHLVVPKKVECLSKSSEFNPDGTIKRLVLDRSKLNCQHIFSVSGVRENFIIVNLDVVESIIRSDYIGIKLKRVEVD
ncbi:MAG TPA: hypothetical protein VIO64_15505 [Pseudobacteroides sp.]|uniref:hypothetical protein n=1 Tax=Pseudobacteroides sp. TaxID=1968840 RepID=UPI002F947486